MEELFSHDMKELSGNIYQEIFKCIELTDNALCQEMDVAQQGRGIKSIAQKVLNDPTFRAVAKKGLEYAPGLYQNIVKRIKNKKVSEILNSDLALLGLSQAIKAGNRLLNVKPKPIGLS